MKTMGIFLDEEKWKPGADKILNIIEGMLLEGSIVDEAAEYVTANVRERWGIVDSNPDN